MPKVKEIEGLIPKIYRRSYIDTSMFWYVLGQRDIMPAISIEKAIYNYFRRAGINDFNIESALVTFTRLQKEYYEATKENK